MFFQAKCALQLSLNGHDMPSSIVPMLYLGGVVCAMNKHTLRRLGVKNILCVCKEPLYHLDHFKYLKIPVEDDDAADLLSHFAECHQFINDAHARGEGVLVHCAAG